MAVSESASAATSTRPHGAALTPYYGVSPLVANNGSSINAASSLATSPLGGLASFSSTVTDGTSKSYTIVGTNPATAGSGSATVNVLIVPLVIKIGTTTIDPTVVNGTCDAGGVSSLARVQQSPLFVSQPWTWGTTAIGTNQFIGAFQRAEFWSYAKPTGVNPTYGLQLAATTASKVTVTVPSSYGTTYSSGCTQLGIVGYSWLDNYIKTTVIPGLGTQISPSMLPLFVVHNVVESTATPPSTTGCCILGWHGAYMSGSAVQTYSISDYENSGDFTGVADISVLTHELGEWANDPTGGNPTNSWGKIGQVSGCQTNFEVGDPLSGTTFADTVGSFTYHPQELAFFSWFYHSSPSLGVNGWYSNQGKFTASATKC